MNVRKKKPVKGAGKGKAKPAQVVAAPRAFGDFCWDYLHDCTHDLNPLHVCPVCLLAQQATRKYLEAEREQKAISKREGVFNRGVMRFELLNGWSKNQGAFTPHLYIGEFAELTLNGFLLESLIRPVGNICFDKLSNILNRRRRILEIGHYAAIFLQCRIRKFCTRKRVRRFMLKRFEWFPATRTKKEYYFDKTSSRKWNKRPAILKNERPGSPRTILRRLGAQDKIYDGRAEKNANLAKKQEQEQGMAYAPNVSPFHEETVAITDYQRLISFHDVTSMALNALDCQQRLEQLRKETSNPSSRNPQQQTIARGSAGMETASVHLSFSSPAPYARAIGMSLALDNTTPISDNDNIIIAEVKPTTASENTDNVPRIKPSASAAMTMSSNERICELEARIWQSLQCRGSEEIIEVLTSCEDIFPVYSSCLNFADDELGVWDAQMKTRQKDSEIAALASGLNRTNSFGMGSGAFNLDRQDSYTMSLAPYQEAEKEKEAAPTGPPQSYHSCEVAPFSVRLSALLPFPATNNRPARQRKEYEIFRLFFLQQPASEFRGPNDRAVSLVAACPNSPWAYYSDLSRGKDLIATALKQYGDSGEVRNMVTQQLRLANLGPEVIDRNKQDFGYSQKQRTSQHSSFFVPSEKYSFPNSMHINHPINSQVTLTTADVFRLHKEHKFLHKLTTWKNEYKIAQRKTGAGGKPKEKKSNLYDSYDMNIGRSGSIEHLRGTSKNTPPPNPLYRLFFPDDPSINVPRTNTTSQMAQAQQDALVYSMNDQVLRDIKGLQYYKLSGCQPDPLASAKKEKSSTLNYNVDEKKYYENLKMAAVMTEARMDSRLVPTQPLYPDTPVTTVHSIAETSPCDMVVLEVYIDLSALVAPPAPARGEENKEGSSSRRTAYLPRSLPVPQLHNMIGAFNSREDKPPPNVDPGLFEWEWFAKQQDEQMNPAVAEDDFAPDGITAFSQLSHSTSKNNLHSSGSGSSSAVGTGVSRWESVHPQSGINTFTLVSALTGYQYQCKIICQQPSRGHLEQVINRKIRLWLGIV